MRSVSLLILCLLQHAAPATESLEGLVDRFERLSIQIDAFEAAQATARAIVDLGERSRDPQIEARGYCRLAFNELHFGHWDPQWESWLQKSIDLSQGSQGLAYGEALATRGFIKGMWQHDFHGALVDLDDAIWVARQLSNDRLLSSSFVRASEMHKFLDHRVKSWDFAFRALHYAETSGDAALRFNALVNLIGCYLLFGDAQDAKSYAAALKELEDQLETGCRLDELVMMADQPSKLAARLERTIAMARERSGESNSRRLLADALFDYAELKFLAGDIDLAVGSLSESRELFKELGDEATFVNATAVWLSYRAAAGDVDGLQAIAEGIEKRFDNIQHNRGAYEVATVMMDTMIRLGESDSALRWKDRSKLIDEDLLVNLRAEAEATARSFWVTEDRLRQQRDQIASGEKKLLGMWAALALMPVLVLGMFGTYRMRTLSSARRMLQERVEAQTKSLNEAKKLAEQANEAKSEFLARFNHELRNPLNVILGVSQLLNRQRVAETGSPNADIDALRVSAQHLQSLVSDVLNVSSIEAGKTDLRLRDFQLSELIEAVENIATQTASNRGEAIDLQITVDHDLPDRMRADDTKLRQILLNVVVNAVNCTTHDGQVCLHFCREHSAHGEFALVVKVSDDGPGIDPERVDVIFDPFVGSDDGSGTGLGLYIGRSLARLLGGTLKLAGTSSDGSCFELKVPVTAAQGHDLQAALSVGASHSDGSRDHEAGTTQQSVLVVDDNPLNRRVACQLLDTLDTVCAHSAESLDEALRQVEQTLPELVLLDLRMPSHDGFQVARAIRERCGGQQPVIVAVTGDATESVKQRALENGFDDFLAKPFRLQDLEMLVRKHGKVVSPATSAETVD